MLALVVSVVATFSAAPLARLFLLRRGVLDVPNHRSSHVVPVPRGGGLACVVGALAGLGTASVFHQQVPWVAIAGALVLAGVGYADDRGALAPVPRLGAQIAVGAMIGSAAGGVGAILAGAVCVPVVVNAVNFMDGINGITSLNMAAWGAVAMAVGYVQGADAVVVIGAVTAGAAIGFLPWNAPIARLFLGDVGSYFFGALVAIGVVTGAGVSTSAILLVAPLTIYLADTGVSLVRRALRGESLLTAHREHVYQRLVDEAHLSHLTVAVTTATLSVLTAAVWVPHSMALGTALTLLLVIVYLASPAILAKFAERTSRKLEGLG